MPAPSPMATPPDAEAEALTAAEPDALTAADAATPTDPEAPTERPPLVSDPFDYSQTVVTLTYTFLPEDGHPEGRLVLLGLRTLGQEPLFSAPFRERSAALTAAVADLQERYRLYLPERKVQVEQEAAAAQAAATLKAAALKAGKMTPNPVPTKHAEPITGGSDAVTVSEKKLSLFGH